LNSLQSSGVTSQQLSTTIRWSIIFPLSILSI
jgi:hypothetical protein